MKIKTIYFLFLISIFISPGIAISADNPEGMVFVPGGPFLMGVDKVVNEKVKKMSKIAKHKYAVSREAFHDEGPAHNVILDAFNLDQYEVSNKQFSDFIKATDHPSPAYWDDRRRNKPRQPVSGVNWNDANAFCSWANKRLPTEAEWEKAARGQSGWDYPWGDNTPTCELANYSGCFDGTIGVGLTTGVSPYGVYDMVGNVWEWTNDLYSGGPERVIKGGSWSYYTENLQVWNSLPVIPEYSYYLIGFRCVRDI
jgi:formylglycine-generating enzyme required for sulfatase activity